MSYCRMDGKTSDVYMYYHVYNFIECYACRLSPGETWWRNVEFQSYTAAIQHLQKHIQHGHKVPHAAIKYLEEDRKVSGDKIMKGQNGVIGRRRGLKIPSRKG